MSLRAWFAGQALAVCAEDNTPPVAAIMAIQYADALIAVLNKPQE